MALDVGKTVEVVANDEDAGGGALNSSLIPQLIIHKVEGYSSPQLEAEEPFPHMEVEQMLAEVTKAVEGGATMLPTHTGVGTCNLNGHFAGTGTAARRAPRNVTTQATKKGIHTPTGTNTQQRINTDPRPCMSASHPNLLPCPTAVWG